MMVFMSETPNLQKEEDFVKGSETKVSEEDKESQLIIKKWRKRARRYMFFSGIAVTLLFLGLSNIKPHATIIIERSYVPCILFLMFLIQQYYQFKKEIKGLEERK